jgi:glycosyltransferase involved in cell wall biosynthesis
MAVSRALFVSTFAPVLGNGRDLRTYTVVRALAQLGPVDLAYVPHGSHEPSQEYLGVEGIAFHQIVPSRGWRRGASFARKLAEGYPSLVARSCSPEISDVARALAEAPDRGRVVAGDLNAMAMLMPMARRRPVIYNAHNIESSYLPRTARDRVRQVRLELLERRILRRAGEAWMVSHRDVARAHELAPSALLRYVPNAVDVAAIAPAPARPGGRTVLMVGDFTYFPNVSGLEWLVDEVLPRVWVQLPDARLRICGRGLDPDRFADPRVEVAGFVDDLAAAYHAADAVAVPLTEGAGTPLKFVEALAYGVPVVGTSVAGRGLDVEPGVHYRCADAVDGFAAELIDVLQHGDLAMAGHARELAEQEYSVEALARCLEQPLGAPVAARV